MPTSLHATLRTDFGKGAARRIRRNDQIPAVLYSKGDTPIHLTLPGHETFLIIKDNINALINVEYDDNTSLALVKDVQRHPVSREIEHLDLSLVTRSQKVDVEVPVIVEGESAPGTIHYLELNSLPVNAPVIDIPEQITISVEGLEDGAVLRVSDLSLPEDVTCELDDEQPLVVVEIPRIDESDLETPGSEDEDEAAEDEQTDEGSEEESEDEES
ncbi:MAG: 50S ribosomal protein L25/general stress protein Ctc [Bowdeniella nasicola]|nr:50S ribosomal protein L25/general stress protein Ctc [Bowdeniella nasicola]